MSKVVIAAWIFALGLIALLGIVLFYKGMRNVQMAVASEKWPVTAGTVVSSETTRSVMRDDSKNTESVTFDTKTTIGYRVNDQAYSTDVLHFGQTLGSSDKSDATLQRLRYPAGAKVPVSYDPGNPSVGVMKPGLHAEAFWLPGAGLAFLLPVALCLFMGPALMQEFSAAADTETDAFAKSVHDAMEAARRGETVTMPAPPRSPSDAVMPIAAAGLGAVFCCLGILALTAGIQRAGKGYASQSWPTTGGKVVSAWKGGGEGGDDAAVDASDSAYRVRFVYRYEVAGLTHYNNVRQFAQAEGGNREETDRIAERYRQGAAVKVSYFPVDPDVAALEPGNTSDAWWLPGIGVVLILFSLAVFIWVVPAVGKPVVP